MKRRGLEYLIFIFGSIVAGYLTVEVLGSYTGTNLDYLPLSYFLISQLGLDHDVAAYFTSGMLFVEIAILALWGLKYKPSILQRPKEGEVNAQSEPAPLPKPDKDLLKQFARKQEMLREVVKPSGNEAYEFVDVFQLDRDLPNTYGAITKDETTGGYRYVVIEPKLSDSEKATYDELRRLLIDELDLNLRAIKDRRLAERYLAKGVRKIAKRYGYKIPPPSLSKLQYYFTRDFIKLGKIEPLLHDYLIEDISCDGSKIPLYVWHRDYESIPTNVVFENDEALNKFVSKLAYVAGKHVSLATPMLDASLPDGSRLQLTYGREITQKGSTFTIRKFKPDPLTIVDLVRYGTIGSEVAAYLWYLIERKLSLLVAGGTASGKTTTLNSLSMFITSGQKIVSCEDTPELNLPHENWIQSVTRGAATTGEITLFDLLKTALRQRPDIIIVGEVRGVEAFTLFQAIATGHGGLGTIHADSVEAVITRLTSEPMNIPKSLVGSTLDCVVMQLKLRVRERSVRRVVNISEVVGHDPRRDEIVLNEAYRWDPVTDKFQFSGRSRLFEKITQRFGTPLEEIKRDIEGRRVFIEWLVSKNTRSYKEVSQQIREFYSDPLSATDRARVELASRSP